jgi:hypothetical protein
VSSCPLCFILSLYMFSLAFLSPLFSSFLPYFSSFLTSSFLFLYLSPSSFSSGLFLSFLDPFFYYICLCFLALTFIFSFFHYIFFLPLSVISLYIIYKEPNEKKRRNKRKSEESTQKKNTVMSVLDHYAPLRPTCSVTVLASVLFNMLFIHIGLTNSLSGPYISVSYSNVVSFTDQNVN